MEKIRCKDFEIKSFRIGSRIKGGAEYAYRVMYDGRTSDKVFYRKEDARKAISKAVRILNQNR